MPETELREKLASEIQGLICDWNAPSQLATDMDSTGLKIADWYLKRSQRQVIEARIDEAEKFETYRHYGKDYQDSLDELAEYKENRLTELQAELERLGKG